MRAAGSRSCADGLLCWHQMYRGLSIATAKVTNEEARGVKHHLLDYLEPTDQQTVVEFTDAANQIISPPPPPPHTHSRQTHTLSITAAAGTHHTLRRRLLHTLARRPQASCYPPPRARSR